MRPTCETWMKVFPTWELLPKKKMMKGDRETVRSLLADETSWPAPSQTDAAAFPAKSSGPLLFPVNRPHQVVPFDWHSAQDWMSTWE